MSYDSDASIATADALILQLHNQHALAAAFEEVAVWLSANGVGIVAENAAMVMQALDITQKGLRMRLCGYCSPRFAFGIIIGKSNPSIDQNPRDEQRPGFVKFFIGGKGDSFNGSIC